ncbi:MAG TPA: ergothioneine biosynthesis glutamate--cysteine ligase EgtA [Acidimicrobiales bacterium]|nr:ergothioneine biosynthesis glutamate--cysteine ligase EgtA [Acidimicrobiales bacterium]
MPAPTRSLTPSDVHDHVRRHCFTPGDSPGRVGVELELLTSVAGSAGRRPSQADLFDVIDGLTPPVGGLLTVEPGGQVELSSRPHVGAAAAIAATATDLRALRSGLAAAGIDTTALGLDPARPDQRVVHGPRYDAMEAYFGGDGGAGMAMMCGTASVQVNLDLGDPAEMPRRWRMAHAVGPVLVAAFANSPLAAGVPTGARSTRQQIWGLLDPTRSAPAMSLLPPADAWARYALAASVILIQAGAEEFVPLRSGLPFGAWMSEGHELGYPTLDDFAYHLTTLFPPVRPKGWFELRMIDALPDPWWQVAVAVTVAVLDDPEAFATAERACRPVVDCWAEAAAHGLSHPGLASAARTCFAAALTALPRLGLDRHTVNATEDFVDRYVDRGRSPADDMLDAWTAGDRSMATASPR